MTKILKESAEVLTGGLVTSPPLHQIGTAEAADSQNLDPRDLRGATTRKGRERFSSGFSSDAGIKGLKSWTRDNATEFLVIRLGTTFYDASTASFASIGIGGTNDERFQAAPLNDILAITVAGLAPQQFSGSTLSDITGSPPSLAKYVIVHQSKVWLAGDTANPQTKTFSATNDPNNYTAVFDAGSITTQDGGGDNIKGIQSNRFYLITFYRHFTDILSGDSVANFREDRLINKGLVSETGHASSGEVAFFASDDAVYMVAGTRVSDITSLKIRETYNDISDKTKVTLGIVGDLLLVVDYDGEKAYAYAYKYGRWHPWTDQPWEVLDLAQDNTLYAGTNDSSSTQVYKIDTGTLDGASAITAFWRTGNMGFGYSDMKKRLSAYRVHAKPGMGTMTVSFFIDGTSTGSSVDHTFASTGDHAWAGGTGQDDHTGHFLGIKFQWTAAGTLIGWSVYSDMFTDPGKIPLEI